MLLRRGTSEDVARAEALLDQAVERYDRIGMPRHAELARLMLQNA
jgi:hypothetical protein